MTERLPFPFSRACIGEGNGNPLQCSCLENPRDRGACGVAQSRTRLKRLSSSSSSIVASQVVLVVKNPPAKLETRVQSMDQEDPMEKEMTIHSSTLAWKIPWTGEPGELQPMGLQRVGHNCVTEQEPTIVLSFE